MDSSVFFYPRHTIPFPSAKTEINVTAIPPDEFFFAICHRLIENNGAIRTNQDSSENFQLTNEP